MEFDLLSLDMIESRKAEYLIEPYLPIGMVSILAGASGVGKSWLALSWAAAVSAGCRLPYTSAGATVEAGPVLYLTTENDASVVLRPRLEKLGASLEHIYIAVAGDSNAQVAPAFGSPVIRDMFEAIRPALVVFDPLQAFVDGKHDFHKATDVRRLLDPLAALASEFRAAVLLISHVSKQGQSGHNGLDRLLGSSDFRNAARSICVMGTDPRDPEITVMAHGKNSLGALGPGLSFKVGADLQYLGVSDCTVDDVLQYTPRKARTATKLDAVTVINDALGSKGYALEKDVSRVAKVCGISRPTLYRARHDMGLRSITYGKDANKVVWWALPDITIETIQASEKARSDELKKELG